MSNGAESPSPTPTWRIWTAAAIGAVALGFGDYLRHGNQSTVIAMRETLGIDLGLVLFILFPILGVAATFIHKPGTEANAFTLGLAVFSLFSLAPPEQTSGGVTKELNVSPPAVQTSFGVIAPSFADELVTPGGSATVMLRFEGSPAPETAVSVRNLTEGTNLGVLTVEDSLKLIGRPGDRIELDFEAAGHQRTKVEVPLRDTGGIYEVTLPENTTPLFWQRLLPASKAEAILAPGGAGAIGVPQ